jgi:glycosyltransferase involved in cell wall biosynthesis
MTESTNRNKADVLIPCAGSAQFFAEALESCLNQTYTDFTVWVIDNANRHSTYSTVANKFVDKRIRYLRFEKRLPMSHNWQRCLSIGEAPLVAFLHDDDIWEQNYLESALECIRNSNSLAPCITPIQRFRESPSARVLLPDLFEHYRLNDLSAGLASIMLFANTACHMSSFIFHRKASINFAPEFNWIPDQHFCDQHILNHGFVLNVDCRTWIRCHPQSVTDAASGDGRKTLEEVERIRRAIISSFEANVFNASTIEELAKIADGLTLYNLAKACYVPPYRKQFKFLREKLLANSVSRKKILGTGLKGRLFAYLPFSINATIANRMLALRTSQEKWASQ